MSKKCEYRRLLVNSAECEEDFSDDDLLDFDRAFDNAKPSDNLIDLSPISDKDAIADWRNNNEKETKKTIKHTKLKDDDKHDQEWHFSLLNIFRENHINGCYQHPPERAFQLFPYLYSVSQCCIEIYIIK